MRPLTSLEQALLGRLLDTTPGSKWPYDLEDLTFTIGLIQRLSSALLDELAHLPPDHSLPRFMLGEGHRFSDDPVTVGHAVEALRCALNALEPIVTLPK